MATNDFLPFAVGSSANVVSQSAYAALAALTNGYQSGVANSAQINKTFRQSSIMAAVLAQFIVAQTGANATDDGTTATLLSNLTAGIQKATPGRLLNVQAFTSSGTYTPTAGTNQIIVEIVGGGGGGGGANAAGAGQVSSGGNGGGGAYAKGRFSSGFSGATVTIGAGGTAGGTGGTGGTTTFGALMSAPGGSGGGAGTAFAPPGSSGGATSGGGSPTGGNVVSSIGFAATAPIALTTGTVFNNVGAASFFGPGPSGGFGAGTNALSRGAGGSGALAGPSTGPFNGGQGAPGYVIIWEYA